MKTDDFFVPGKVSFVLDVSAGSSGKGTIESYLVKHSTTCKFAISSNSPNASHTVCDDKGTFVFKILPTAALYHGQLDMVYIVAGATFDTASLEKEMKYCGIPRNKVMVHPRCGIVTVIDEDYEKGLLYYCPAWRHCGGDRQQPRRSFG